MILVIKNIREDLNSKANNSIKYSSFQKYHDDNYKHKRVEINPNETFKSPLTYNHGYGFYKFNERNLNEIKYPKKKCEETKYAESIILTGNKFMK